MKQDYFPGWEKFEGIRVIEFEGRKKVLVMGQPYMSWRVEDDSSQRMAIVQLYNSGLGTSWPKYLEFTLIRFKIILLLLRGME